MPQEIYSRLCSIMAKRGGPYPGLDIPEFYALVEELFTPEQAEVFCAVPRGGGPAQTTAEALGRDAAEIKGILEKMADQGLIAANELGGVMYYLCPPFVPGIFEYQFMRGTSAERDRKLARLIHAYKKAVDKRKSPSENYFPTGRVIIVDRTVQAGNRLHTYDQVVSYIEAISPLSVSTCFCRHEAWLIDENDSCGKPNEVCMQFGPGARFVIDRGLGREISKKEALEILTMAEEAGLVHASANRQDIDFLCNCCSCHCMIIKEALAQPKPGLALNSGFQPDWDAESCTGCETCVERCPADALEFDSLEKLEVDPDRCFGCGVCAVGCPSQALVMIARPDIPPPPADRKALREAVKAGRAG